MTECGLSGWLANLPFETQYLLWGCIMANLPGMDIENINLLSLIIYLDLDVILTKLFGLNLNESHRTWSHSLYCSIIYIPILSAITRWYFEIGLIHSFLLSGLCFLSHLYTDWITSYGTSLFWPLDKRMLTLGVITIFDLPTLIIWYIHFYLSATGGLSPLWALISFNVFLSAFLYWRRLMLIDVYSKNDITEDSQPVVWLNPSNIFPNKFYIMSWNEETKDVKVEKIAYGGIPTAEARKRKDYYACVAPRESFLYMQKNAALVKSMLLEAFPSIVLLFAHAYWFLVKYL